MQTSEKSGLVIYGNSIQFGGGGFNGVLITGLTLVPGATFNAPAPLTQGYVTYGTDSGHQNAPNRPVQAFALNDEALVKFGHASYKKVRDVAVAVMQIAYGRAPQALYFVGSSEGGREGLTMAQRYPKDFNGVFARVPVINWTGLQHAGLKDGLALMDGGWMNPAQVKLVHAAVLQTCDDEDGLVDGVVSNYEACASKMNLAVRWKYGVPLASNANYRWLQHVLHHLAPNCTAGVVLANGSMSSNASGEGCIRKHGYMLTWGRFVGAEAVDNYGEPIEVKVPRLEAELNAKFEQSAKIRVSD